MSYAEDMGFDTYDKEDFHDLEDAWEGGYHLMKNGEEIELEDMSTSHLKNTIQYFESFKDVTALKEELKNRLRIKL